MKKVFCPLVILVFTLLPQIAFGSIQLSVADDKFGDEYSAVFQVTYTGSGVFGASLSNTSDPLINPEPLVSKFAWNMDGNPKLGTDFEITDISPSSWTFKENKENGKGILFDYIGGSKNKDRLGAGDVLTFKMNFEDGIVDELNPYSLFLNSDTRFGKGFSGGEVSGQVVIKFQQLGEGGGESDLLGGNWTPLDPIGAIPEPASVICWSLLGFCAIGAKRHQRKQRQS